MKKKVWKGRSVGKGKVCLAPGVLPEAGRICFFLKDLSPGVEEMGPGQIAAGGRWHGSRSGTEISRDLGQHFCCSEWELSRISACVWELSKSFCPTYVPAALRNLTEASLEVSYLSSPQGIGCTAECLIGFWSSALLKYW